MQLRRRVANVRRHGSDDTEAPFRTSGRAYGAALDIAGIYTISLILLTEAPHSGLGITAIAMLSAATPLSRSVTGAAVSSNFTTLRMSRAEAILSKLPAATTRRIYCAFSTDLQAAGSCANVIGGFGFGSCFGGFGCNTASLNQ
jgi:hypothetical protein